MLLFVKFINLLVVLECTQMWRFYRSRVLVVVRIEESKKRTNESENKQNDEFGMIIKKDLDSYSWYYTGFRCVRFSSTHVDKAIPKWSKCANITYVPVSDRVSEWVSWRTSVTGSKQQTCMYQSGWVIWKGGYHISIQMCLSSDKILSIAVCFHCQNRN